MRARARGGGPYEASRYWPWLSIFCSVFSSSSGGDIKLTEKPARASECEPRRVFIQPVAPGINSFGSGG